MTNSATEKNDVALEDSIPQGMAPLESIIYTEELHRRPWRAPDYEKENRALVALMSALADSPATIFQTLAETILEITQSDSAGLSLLTKDGKTPDVGGKRFYWPAIVGMWSSHVGGGTPRNFGPCGDVLDRNCTLLFKHFERRYPYLMPVSPAAEECLLVPFYVRGKAVGTIWGMMHSDRRKYDAEDDRVMASLGKFASSAYEALMHIEDLRFQVQEREKAEAEVRKLASGLEAKFRRLVDANILGIFLWNVDGRIVEANEAFLRMIDRTDAELVSGGMRWTDLTPPEWHELDARAVAEVRENGAVQHYEKEFLRKDGARVPVMIGAAMFEKGGNEGVAFVLDLTEQKQQESARLYSEERYRVVVETASDAIVSIDSRGTIVFANPATSAVFGYEQVELTGQPLTMLMPESMREAHKGGFARYLATGKRQISWQGTELAAVRKNGEEFPIEISFGEMTGESGKTFTGILRDISKRKQAEHALRRSEAFLAEGQHLGQIGSFSWRVATDEITWSTELYRIYEFEPGVKVTRAMIRGRVHPEDLSLIEKMTMIGQSREGGEDFEWHFRLLMPDGSIKYLHAVAHASRDQDGRLEYIASIQDVTARRLAEEARDKARSELAHVARVVSLGTLTASIAHEVNQPLTAITNNGNACLRLLARNDLEPEVLRGALEEIVADGIRASGIITRIRSFLKKKTAERNALDINEVIHETVSLVGRELAENRIRVEYRMTQALPLVSADRVQMQQVLLNLMMNGIEAMSGNDDDGKLLRVESRMDESGDVLVAVCDAGTGIGPELERVFEPFYTTKSKGMGMGLSISRSLVEGHGGHLWATANSPCGSVFNFTLPAAPGSSS